MKEINVDVVPELPFKGILNDECVAMGVIEGGVLVHYLSRDKAIIVEWVDMVGFGIDLEKQKDLVGGIEGFESIVKIKKPTKE